MAVLCNPGH